MSTATTMDEAPNITSSEGKKDAPPKTRISRKLLLFLVLAVLFVAGLCYWLYARHYESTDDAFIDGRSVLVSPQVTGSIISVNVTDNQIVKKGDLLATIDARNYKAAVDQADAQIRQNEATEKKLRSPDRRPESPGRSGYPTGRGGRIGAQIRNRRKLPLPGLGAEGRRDGSARATGLIRLQWQAGRP